MLEFCRKTHPDHNHLHNIKYACQHISDPLENSDVHSPFYACTIFLEFDKRDFRNKSQYDNRCILSVCNLQQTVEIY